MLNKLMNYWPLVFFVLVVALFAVSFLIPGWSNAIAGIVIVLSLSIAVYSIVQKQIGLARGEPMSKFKVARNILVELTGILLAMLLAVFAGRFVADVATQQVDNDFIKIAAGILIGSFIGMVMGIIIRRVWGRLVAIDS